MLEGLPATESSQQVSRGFWDAAAELPAYGSLQSGESGRGQRLVCERLWGAAGTPAQSHLGPVAAFLDPAPLMGPVNRVTITSALDRACRHEGR